MPDIKPQGVPGDALRATKGGKGFADPEEGGPKKPSPEEQMAAFEEDLKESDWGHQPC